LVNGGEPAAAAADVEHCRVFEKLMDGTGDDEVTREFVEREEMFPPALAILGVECRRGHGPAVAGGIAHKFLQEPVFDFGEEGGHEILPLN